MPNPYGNLIMGNGVIGGPAPFQKGSAPALGSSTTGLLRFGRTRENGTERHALRAGCDRLSERTFDVRADGDQSVFRALQDVRESGLHGPRAQEARRVDR